MSPLVLSRALNRDPSILGIQKLGGVLNQAIPTIPEIERDLQPGRTWPGHVTPNKKPRPAYSGL